MKVGTPNQLLFRKDDCSTRSKGRFEQIRQAVTQALLLTTPDLASDLYESGIIISGGGALLQDIDIVIHQHTNLRATVAEEPLKCVVNGTGFALSKEQQFRSIIDYSS